CVLIICSLTISGHMIMPTEKMSDKRVVYLVYEVAKLLRRRFESVTRAHELTLTQWRAMAQINRQPEISQAVLAAATDSDPMTMSGVLERLERRGLIERYPDPTDSRAKLARLTEDGTQLLTAASKISDELHALSLDGFTPQEREILMQGLSRIRDNLLNNVVE